MREEASINLSLLLAVIWMSHSSKYPHELLNTVFIKTPILTDTHRSTDTHTDIGNNVLRLSYLLCHKSKGRLVTLSFWQNIWDRGLLRLGHSTSVTEVTSSCALKRVSLEMFRPYERKHHLSFLVFFYTRQVLAFLFLQAVFCLSLISSFSQSYKPIENDMFGSGSDVSFLPRVACVLCYPL